MYLGTGLVGGGSMGSSEARFTGKLDALTNARGPSCSYKKHYMC